MSFFLRGRSSGEGDSNDRIAATQGGPHWWLWVALPGAFFVSSQVAPNIFGVGVRGAGRRRLLSAFQCMAGSPSSALGGLVFQFQFPNLTILAS
jgi:hypothetical protein